MATTPANPVTRTPAQLQGERIERLALSRLLDAGLRLVARNFRCRVGEIDLVMLDGDCLVFVEVRYRRRNRFATARESVGAHKRRKLAKAALFFLARHPAFDDHPVRFDVVACDATAPDQYRLQWLKDAFRPD